MQHRVFRHTSSLCRRLISVKISWSESWRKLGLMDLWADVYHIVGTVEAVQTQLSQMETILLEFLDYTTTQLQVTLFQVKPWVHCKRSRNIFIFSQGSGHKPQTKPCQKWAWKKLSMAWLRAGSTQVRQLGGMCLHSRGQFACLKAWPTSRFFLLHFFQHHCLYQCTGRNKASHEFW